MSKLAENDIIHVFRLQESSYTGIGDFFSSRQTDIITTIYPSSKTRRDIMLEEHPNLEIVPLQMRLIKYQIGNDTFCLGTTLVDQNQYSNMQDFVDIYHIRLGGQCS